MAKKDFNGLPKVTITLADFSALNATTDTNGSIKIENNYGSDYPAETLYSDTLFAQFKIAGNSTAAAAKKPIGISLNKTLGSGSNLYPILGMQPHNKWRLLAGAYDKTGDLRNNFAFTSGNKMPMFWTPDTRAVELYYKTGSGGTPIYQGTFLMCETVKQGVNRINVSGANAFICETVINSQIEAGDLANCFSTPLYGNTTATGNNAEYLNTLFNTGNHAFLLDYKGTGVNVTNTSAYINQLELDIIAAGTGGNFSTVWSKIDFDSTVVFYVWQEFLKSIDGPSHGYRVCRDNSNGVYGGKVFFIGWDFDLSAGGYNNSLDYTIGYATGLHMATNWWFRRFLLDPNFLGAVKERWSAYRGLFSHNIEVNIKNADFATANGSAARNWAKWYADPAIIVNAYNDINDASYTGAVERQVAWYRGRIEYLSSIWL